MNPLRPSPRLLRHLAGLLSSTEDRQARAWAEALAAIPRPARSPQFAHVSIVKTYRDARLCGFEVWRHLESSTVDPKRQKARLWFGCRRHGPKRAFTLAQHAARMLEAMSQRELHEWWGEYRAARKSKRTVTNLWRDEDSRDGLDFTDLQQLSHVFDRSA